MGNNKKNYSKMSTEKAKTETVVADLIEETAVTEPIIEKAKEPKPEPKVKKGVVVNCDRLNVRTNPHVNAAIETVITKGTEVVITDSHGDFYFVRKDNTTEGFNGWCMKKYISVKK